MNCKYCGAELSDYRGFCDAFCKANYEEDKADFYHNDRDFETIITQNEETENEDF